MKTGGILEKSRINPPANDSLIQLLEKLYAKVNLDFREYKISSVKRRIGRRLRATRSDSYQAYCDFLDGNPDEYEKLLSDLTINITEFFRDDLPWQIFQNRVLPNILSGRTSDNFNVPVRIWSAGCATGQEAYSAAILFNELNKRQQTPCPFEIFATDIDQKSLETAQQGLFKPESLVEMDTGIIDTYFEQGKHYRIRPWLQKQVHFQQHDLILDAPLTDMDSIICRNVAIYFSRQLQEKLYHNFYHSLRNGGYLFLGKAESLFGEIGKKFRPVNTKWKLYQKQ